MLMHQIDIQDKISFEIIDKTDSLQQAIENIKMMWDLARFMIQQMRCTRI